MKCPHCDREHPADSQFCPRTGKKIIIPSLCPGCGQPVDPAWTFCNSCGLQLATAVEAPKPPEPPPAILPAVVPPPANKGHKWRWLIVIVVIAALVILALIWDIARWQDTGRYKAATLTAIPPTATAAPTKQIVFTKVMVPSPTIEIVIPNPTIEILAPSPTIEVIVPKPTGDTRERIVFTSIRDGNLQIYAMNTDGSAQTRISNNSFNDSDPSWSPDGQKIAFVSTRNASWGIYVMNADGSNPVNLANGPGASDPTWSPDGQQIAFAITQDQRFEIYRINADGSELKRLTDNNSNDHTPAWSPDGQKIAFVSDRDGNDEIYVMNADGTGQARLTWNAAVDGNPDWSPDGQMIAFNSGRDGVDQIFSMRADGSAPTRLTDNRSIYQYPNWSADGKKIAYVSLQTVDAQIFIMNADGSDPIQVTNRQSIDYDPDWGPGSSAASIQPTPSAQAQVPQVVDKAAGIAFTVPEGINLYSVTNPGPLQAQLSEKEPYILVNPGFPDENVNIIISGNLTAADLAGYKKVLESQTYTMPVQGYKKISVGYINIGKNGQIQAVDHRFQMQGNVLGSMRSITFVIGTRGYIITCGTAVDRFEKTNKEFFEPFLNSIEPAN